MKVGGVAKIQDKNAHLGEELTNVRHWPHFYQEQHINARQQKILEPKNSEHTRYKMPILKKECLTH